MEFIDNLPGWVWAIALPALALVAGFVARKTKNKVDDWLVALILGALEAFLRSRGIEVDLDGSDTKIRSASGGSIQLEGVGIAAPSPRSSAAPLAVSARAAEDAR